MNYVGRYYKSIIKEIKIEYLENRCVAGIGKQTCS